MERGYAFLRLPYTAPSLICPNGAKIDLEVHGNIPYISKDTKPYFPSTVSAPVVIADEPFDRISLPTFTSSLVAKVASAPNAKPEQAFQSDDFMVCGECHETPIRTNNIRSSHKCARCEFESLHPSFPQDVCWSSRAKEHNRIKEFMSDTGLVHIIDDENSKVPQRHPYRPFVPFFSEADYSSGCRLSRHV